MSLLLLLLLLLLLEGLLLLLQEANFVTFLQSELRVFAVDAFGVDGTSRLLYLSKDFQQILSVDFTGPYQS